MVTWDANSEHNVGKWVTASCYMQILPVDELLHDDDWPLFAGELSIPYARIFLSTCPEESLVVDECGKPYVGGGVSGNEDGAVRRSGGCRLVYLWSTESLSGTRGKREKGQRVCLPAAERGAKHRATQVGLGLTMQRTLRDIDVTGFDGRTLSTETKIPSYPRGVVCFWQECPQAVCRWISSAEPFVQS